MFTITNRNISPRRTFQEAAKIVLEGFSSIFLIPHFRDLGIVFLLKKNHLRMINKHSAVPSYATFSIWEEASFPQEELEELLNSLIKNRELDN